MYSTSFVYDEITLFYEIINSIFNGLFKTFSWPSSRLVLLQNIFRNFEKWQLIAVEQVICAFQIDFVIAVSFITFLELPICMDNHVHSDIYCQL